LQFEACGDPATARAVQDASHQANDLIDELGGDGAITVLLRLAGDSITTIRYAGPGEIDCNRLPASALVEARGNEPFWSFSVEDESALFRTPELPDGVQYTDGLWTRAEVGMWTYEAERASAAMQGASADSALAARSQTRVRLDLTETECRDGMSGARYPYRAVLTRYGDTLEGCALEGRRAM
jgi:uncharacterized membrane protein